MAHGNAAFGSLIIDTNSSNSNHFRNLFKEDGDKLIGMLNTLIQWEEDQSNLIKKDNGNKDSVDG